MLPMRDVFNRPVFARTRKLCLALPGTTEIAAWGHPTFRAGRKTFCAFEIIRGRPSIAFRLTPPHVDRVLTRRDAFATPYGRRQWASLWVDGDVDGKAIQSLVEAGYRCVATTRMLAALDAGGTR
jgi:predicted DNA-binding protein (MmcQ/YjbR family)